jgi:predicted nucleic acid-binding protein
MTERLAADTNAVVAFLRDAHSPPPLLHQTRQVFLPLPVAGELFAGAHHSRRVIENLAKVEEVVAGWTILSPDLATARVYGKLRGAAGEMPSITAGRVNDLWIAALCIQHSLPLLTRARQLVAALSVIAWSAGAAATALLCSSAVRTYKSGSCGCRTPG